MDTWQILPGHTAKGERKQGNNNVQLYGEARVQRTGTLLTEESGVDSQPRITRHVGKFGATSEVPSPQFKKETLCKMDGSVFLQLRRSTKNAGAWTTWIYFSQFWGRKSAIRVSPRSGSGENSLPGLQTATFSSYKDINPIVEGLRSWSYLNLITSQRPPSSSHPTAGWDSKIWFGGHTNMQSTTGKPRDVTSAYSFFIIPKEKENEVSKTIDGNPQERPECSYLKSYEQNLEDWTHFKHCLKNGHRKAWQKRH